MNQCKKIIKKEAKSLREITFAIKKLEEIEKFKIFPSQYPLK